MLTHFPARDWRLVPDCELPATDPHGREWRALTTRELEEVSGWCMSGEHHEALRRVRIDRLARAQAASRRPLIDVGDMLTSDGLGS